MSQRSRSPEASTDSNGSAQRYARRFRREEVGDSGSDLTSGARSESDNESSDESLPGSGHPSPPQVLAAAGPLLAPPPPPAVPHPPPPPAAVLPIPAGPPPPAPLDVPPPAPVAPPPLAGVEHERVFIVNGVTNIIGLEQPGAHVAVSIGMLGAGELVEFQLTHTSVRNRLLLEPNQNRRLGMKASVIGNVVRRIQAWQHLLDPFRPLDGVYSWSQLAGGRATRICWLKSSLESHIHPVSLRIADADELDVV